MKLHIVTVGQPKLAYAKQGFEEYIKRLGRYHDIRVTHIPDKHNNADKIHETAGNGYKIALTIDGPQLTSEQLSELLDQKAHDGQELCFMIGGPEGLPDAVQEQAQKRLGLSKLTFPHDLAMLVLAETLYRSSTISAGHPYHK